MEKQLKEAAKKKDKKDGNKELEDKKKKKEIENKGTFVGKNIVKENI